MGLFVAAWGCVPDAAEDRRGGGLVERGRPEPTPFELARDVVKNIGLRGTRTCAQTQPLFFAARTANMEHTCTTLYEYLMLSIV